MLFRILLLTSFWITTCLAVSPQVLEKVRPYLLPADHPAKPALDYLLQGQPLKDEAAFANAGFVFQKRSQPERQVICAKHRKLKGYLVKTYLDTHQGVGKEERNWIRRIQGAMQIQQSITRHSFQKIMKVPKKWIYLLPDNPSVPRRRFVLIVEDMEILGRDANFDAYFFRMSRPRLDALYTLLTENLLFDSIYIDNIPFCKDGKIAFIDTEHFNSDSPPLRLHLLTKRFCPPMAKYWSELIQTFKQPGSP